MGRKMAGDCGASGLQDGPKGHLDAQRPKSNSSRQTQPQAGLPVALCSPAMPRSAHRTRQSLGHRVKLSALGTVNVLCCWGAQGDYSPQTRDFLDTPVTSWSKTLRLPGWNDCPFFGVLGLGQAT